MTVANAEQRPSSPPYSALRAVGDDRGAARGATAQPDAAYLTEETEKLESLKRALFDAFLAAPSSGIPTPLVDLAATYTNALRLQLTLMGYTASPRRSYRSPAPAVSRKQP